MNKITIWEFDDIIDKRKFLSSVYGALKGFVDGETLMIEVTGDVSEKTLAGALDMIADIVQTGSKYSKDDAKSKTDDDDEDDADYWKK